MPTQQTVLLVGGTGRTGRRVLEQLLSSGINVRVIVRSALRLPAGAADHPELAVIEADLMSFDDEALQRHLCGCDAVLSCLGHVLSFKGVFSPPRDLVARATMRLCRGIEALKPSKPVKVILMTSVSVHHPGGLDTRRGMLEKAIMWMLRGVLPPARDNQQAANFLHDDVGSNNRYVQWAVIRPDTLREGGVSEYTLHDLLPGSLFTPDDTNMQNVAHAMCELVTSREAWDDWKGKLPVIINRPVSRS